MTVDEYIDELDLPRREIAEALREIVREAAPAAKESIKWGMSVFEEKGLVCYIGAMKAYVNFGFYRGTELPDPDGLLEGTGKKLRHVKLRQSPTTREDALKKLVEEAVRLNLWP